MMEDNGSQPHLVRRVIAIVLVVDGIGTALLGYRFLDWQAQLGVDWYNRTVLRFFYRWPEPLLRAGGLLQSIASLLFIW